MSKIFINYRRSDSQAFVQHLFHRLSQIGDKKNIFLDVNSIPIGESFDKVVENSIKQCDIFFVIIGEKWISSLKKTFHKANQSDFVIIEIEQALKLKVKIIPVLIDDSKMPQKDDLPFEIQPLALINGMQFRNNRFDDDFKELIRNAGLLGNSNITQEHLQILPKTELQIVENKKVSRISKDISFTGYGYGSKKWFNDIFWDLKINFHVFFDSEWDFKLHEIRIDFYMGKEPVIDKNRIIKHYVTRDEMVTHSSGTCEIIVEKRGNPNEQMNDTRFIKSLKLDSMHRIKGLNIIINLFSSRKGFSWTNSIHQINNDYVLVEESDPVFLKNMNNYAIK